jgi:membrane-associated phospholipid phosphatase
VEQTRVKDPPSVSLETGQSRSDRRTGLIREVLLVGLAYFIYSQVRGLAGDRVIDAFANGYRIVDLENDLGIFKELALQTLILPHDTVVHFFNIIYFYGLFPLLMPTAIWLYFKKPDVYNVARNAFLISGAIAVCFFLILPTAPPRLIGMGFIDTLSDGLAPSYSSIPGVNHFAALPSMHVGWNFLTSVAIYLALAGVKWRFAILLLPPIMALSTVVTGNHYFLDGALGVVVAAVALLLALKLQKMRSGANIEFVHTARADDIEQEALTLTK